MTAWELGLLDSHTGIIYRMRSFVLALAFLSSHFN